MTTTSSRYQVNTFVQITRFSNSVYAAVYTVLGAYLAGGGSIMLAPTLLGAALVVGVIVAYGFVINDYRDVVVDSIGKPHRPIPAGHISQQHALWLALALAGLALVVAALLGAAMFGVAVATVALAAFYSYALKGTVLWGNACMALLISSIVVYGSLATGGVPLIVWIVAGLMWLFDFSHEILKTTADWQGDAAARLRTVATAFGVRGAVRVFQVAALLFLAVALLPWALGLAPAAYGYALVVCTILPTLAVVVMLWRSSSTTTITLALRVMRWMWITNLVPILLLV